LQNECRGSSQTRDKRGISSHEGVYDTSYVPKPGRTLTQGPIQVFLDETSQTARQSAEDDKGMIFRLNEL